MPDLPRPASRRPDDGWATVLAQLAPMLVSLIALGAMSASLGHPGLALLLMAGTGLAALTQLDLQLRRRRGDQERLRAEYGAALADLAPAADWAVPPMPQVDPVCRVLAARAALRLRREADVPREARATDPTWPLATSSTLVALLAPGVTLDLREAASGGIGPHGVIVGATGAGKSELLRTLILSLALRLPPDRLTLLGLDFKGGTGLGDLERLPHSVGLVTNLEASPRLITRVCQALDHEVDRRQALVRDGSTPVPLVVVIDEFGELLTQQPELLPVLVRIGRLGRSLGLHLVLASQRLDEHRLRELDSHLSWRLALRTFTETDSRALLGRPDAAALPRAPGWALLRSGPEDLQRFRVQPFTRAETDAALRAIERRRAARAETLWLPPLTESPRLADLLTRAGPGLPIGVSDDPVHRTPVLLSRDLRHVAIVGGPDSGKSTLLTTLDRAVTARSHRPVLTVDARHPDPALLDHLRTAEATVLLIDDWGVLRTEHPLLEDALVRAAAADPRLALVLTASRWADVRPALRDLLSTRIELRLPDPLDSLIDRRLAADVPQGQPGQGIVDLGGGAVRFLAALPHPDPPRC